MQTIMSEKFGLYQIEVGQEESTRRFFCDIDFLDEDGSKFGHWSDNQPYPTGLDAFRVGMLKLARLFWHDLEAIAGNGIRTHDILLGNFPLSVKPSDLMARSTEGKSSFSKSSTEEAQS